MSDGKDRIGTVGSFFRLLKNAPKSRYLALENLLTGGLKWHIRAWLAERRVARATENQFEASGDEFDVSFKAWQELDYQARFGSPLSKVGKIAVRRFVDEGVSEPEIRSWIVNLHMSPDGALMPRYSGWLDSLVRQVGWLWNALVALTATLLVVFTLDLPGQIIVKTTTIILLLFFFLLMSVLMNSISISALPPKTKPSN